MSDRHKPHNGRDLGGSFKVKQVDVEDTMEDPGGPDYVRDDVRLAGAVEDTGSQAGQRGERIERLIEDNREAVRHATRDETRDEPEGGA